MVDELVKMIRRLSVNETAVRHRNNNFDALRERIESEKDVELSEYTDMMYYRGKTEAYFWVLEHMVGNTEAIKLLFNGLTDE